MSLNLQSYCLLELSAILHKKIYRKLRLKLDIETCKSLTNFFTLSCNGLFLILISSNFVNLTIVSGIVFSLLLEISKYTRLVNLAISSGIAVSLLSKYPNSLNFLIYIYFQVLFSVDC